ncbi:MAG: hypothetical protein GXP31_14670 [Kiritimatiellaeota bacterium]|nr:hypothetical protein [Kiritimatiellota bacterium]
MQPHIDSIDDHFSLAAFPEVLRRFRPPAADFDPTGSWRCSYRMYTHTMGAAVVGRVEVSRRSRGADGAELKIEIRRNIARRCTQFVRAVVQCGTGPLATPTGWRLVREVREADGKLVPDLRAEETATVGKQGVHIRRGGKERLLPVRSPWTSDWALFEALPRMPRTSGSELRFALIEDFELLRPGQILAFRKTARIRFGAKRTWQYVAGRRLEKGEIDRPVVEVGGGSVVAAVAFERTGPGTVPVVAWLDQAGRILLVLSGQSAMVLA